MTSGSTHPRDGLFALYALGEGTESCLHTSRTAPDGEMPVVAVDPAGEAREEIASDFGSALLALVREELDFGKDN